MLCHFTHFISCGTPFLLINKWITEKPHHPQKPNWHSIETHCNYTQPKKPTSTRIMQFNRQDKRQVVVTLLSKTHTHTTLDDTFCCILSELTKGWHNGPVITVKWITQKAEGINKPTDHHHQHNRSNIIMSNGRFMQRKRIDLQDLPLRTFFKKEELQD